MYMYSYKVAVIKKLLNIQHCFLLYLNLIHFIIFYFYVMIDLIFNSLISWKCWTMQLSQGR